MAGYPSSWISQSIAAQNAGFAQNNYLAQQMSMPMPGAAMGGQMMAPPPAPVMMPPPPPAMGMQSHFRGDRGGMMGETAAAHMASFGSNVAAPIMGGMASMVGADPFSLTMRAGMAGFAGGGVMGGAAAAGAVAMPLYAGAKLAQTYGSAFTGGMQDQAALNSTLRNNFNFLGGSRGQGFNQQQMGSIGGVVQNELNNNMFTSANELNSLIGQGAQGGMFTGVRDVGEFSKKFRNMLDTLKSVQRELGGSLNEAMQFVQEAKNSGIFNRLDRQNFAGQIREVTQITGMSREDAMMMASQGAQIARQAGGSGAQGAFGAMRTARGLGSALSTGAINEGQLSEATGGLTGQAAIQAFGARMMQHTARFSRRPMGRFGLFAMADPRNVGQLDQGAMQQFLAGDLSVGDVSRRAHSNVNQMGRAQAMNREGELRGAMLEQGGMAGQIGMMRLMLGDRVMNSGDDMSQLVMQRRFGMSRQEAGVMQDLMRNQGSIAQRELTDRSASARSARREDVRRERGLDAVMDRLGHEIEHGLGVHEVRQMGRNFVTKLSSAGQRVMDRMLGIYTEEMSQGTQGAFDRIYSGQGTSSDYQRLQSLPTAGAAGGGGFNPFQQSVLGRMSGQETLGARLEGMGYNISGLGTGQSGRINRSSAHGGRAASQSVMRSRTIDAVAELDMARGGLVSAEHQGALAAMEGNTAGTNRSLRLAMIQARGSGRDADFLSAYGQRGGDRQAAVAYMARQGMADPVGDLDMSQVGTGAVLGMFGTRDEGRRVSSDTRDALMGVGGLLGGALGAGLGAGAADMLGDLNIIGTTRREDAVSFLARGGNAARLARENADAARGGGRTREVNGRQMTATEREHYFRTMGQGLAVDPEAMDALTQEESVRRLMMRMTNGGADARAAFAELESLGLSEGTDSARGQALRTLATNAEQAMSADRRRGGSGRIDRSLAALATSPTSTADAAAAAAQRAEAAARFASAASTIGEMEGMEMTAEALRAVSAGAATGQDRWAGNALRGEIDRISRLDPEERRRVLGNLGRVGAQEGQERLQQIGLAAAQRGQLRESLMGRGRGGRRAGRQRIESASQALGGLGMGRDFSIELGSGDRTRQVSGRRAQAMFEQYLSGGGNEESRAAVEAALQRQGDSMNMSDEMRNDMLGAIRGIATASSEEERAAAADVIQGNASTGQQGLRERYSADFQRIEEQRASRALAAAGRQDPLGQRRNEILERIANNTEATADSAPGPTGGQPGVNMSGGE